MTAERKADIGVAIIGACLGIYIAYWLLDNAIAIALKGVGL